MNIISSVPVKSAALHAVVTRADGTVEDLGVIAYWHKNPLRRALYALKRWCRLTPRITT